MGAEAVVVIEVVVAGIVLPWIIWVTTSLFNQRQNIALLQQELKTTKEIYILLQEKLR